MDDVEEQIRGKYDLRIYNMDKLRALARELAAERDELQRRLDAVLEMLEPGAAPALAKVIHQCDLQAGRSGYYGDREADMENALAVLAHLRGQLVIAAPVIGTEFDE